MNEDNKVLWHANIIPVLNEWKHFQISLLKSSATVKGTESFETIMSNVSRLAIRGEYCYSVVMQSRLYDMKFINA